jgi:solute carrier family 25 protein 39/40
VLWRGTDVALMMAIPMVGVYLPLYDYLLEKLQQEQAGAVAPLAAGTLARMAAVYCTAPFELARTRLQAAPSQGTVQAAAVAAGMQAGDRWSSCMSSVLPESPLPSGFKCITLDPSIP